MDVVISSHGYCHNPGLTFDVNVFLLDNKIEQIVLMWHKKFGEGHIRNGIDNLWLEKSRVVTFKFCYIASKSFSLFLCLLWISLW